MSESKSQASATPFKLSKAVGRRIDEWLAKFPADQRRSALLMALRIVQEELGYLSDEALDAVADYLAIPAVQVYEVASFYSMYTRKPRGEVIIRVCTSVSCALCGAQEVVRYLEGKLGIKLGETTADGRFSLLEGECLAACCGAPMLQIDDQTIHENLTPATIDAMLAEIAKTKGWQDV